MAVDRAAANIPPLVATAMRLAHQMALDHSCLPEVGRLLCLLSSQVTEGIIGEVDSWVGVGTARLASGLRAGTRLVSVESQPCRAATVHKLFADNRQVTILRNDWRVILPYGPFSLVFIDGQQSTTCRRRFSRRSDPAAVSCSAIPDSSPPNSWYARTRR